MLCPPGRMAPATALSFFMVGVALLALKAPQPRFAAWPHWLVVPPLFISTLAVVGYAYGVSSLYEVRAYSSMAAHTALAFFILTLSILAADLAHGFSKIATSDTAGGVVSRRLLPTLPLILFALGWVRLAGQEAGLYDTRFGTALMVLLSITVCTIAVASTGITLDKIDVTRRRAEGEVASLNAGLERRVQQRIQQLAEVSAELSAANASLEQLSLHDGLTTLANRRFFDKYLADQIAIARRHKRSHLRDWTFNQHRGAPNSPHKTLTDYQIFLEQQCSSFGYIRDLANAVKHAELDRPSTQMIGLANTELLGPAFQPGAFQNIPSNRRQMPP